MLLQRTSKIISIFIIAVVSLLSACSKNSSPDDGFVLSESSTSSENIAVAPTPEQTGVINDALEQSSDVEPQNLPKDDNSNHVTSPSGLDYTPAVRIGLVLENDSLVIAECTDFAVGDDRTSNMFLLTDTQVLDVLISRVLENEDGYIESRGLSYIPELIEGQAVVLFDFFDFNDFYKIAYTNDNGNFESVLLFLNEDGVPELTPIEPKIMDTLWVLEFYPFYHSFYYYSESELMPNELTHIIRRGDFNEFIPTGFCISNVSLGDINNDGIEDALICLTTGCYHAAGYTGDTPLLILIGQSDGSYIIEQKLSGVLFTPYRSSSYPFAGTGYIDIVYDYVGGAVCSHIYANRFIYDSTNNDWFLKLISFQPGYSIDWSEQVSPAFINPLPDLIDLPLGQFDQELFYNSQTHWEYFDEVATLTIPSYNDFNDVYTLAVLTNSDAGYYEGYIHMYFEAINSGGFIQTIRGEYEKGMSLVVTSNDAELSFHINDDVWVLSAEDSDAFHILE